MANFHTSNVVELSSKLKSVTHLLTHIRSDQTQPTEFRHYSNRLMNILCEEAIALKCDPYECMTPTNSLYKGILLKPDHVDNIIAVSIMRGGDSMLSSFMTVCPNAKIGKILIQRDEATCLPKLFYTKLPVMNRDNIIFLLDPMLGTGGSALMAIEEIVKSGGLVKNIIYITVVASPEGIQNVTVTHPELILVTGEIDKKLNEKVSQLQYFLSQQSYNISIYILIL